jgi:hypothetical protein
LRHARRSTCTDRFKVTLDRSGGYARRGSGARALEEGRRPQRTVRTRVAIGKVARSSSSGWAHLSNMLQEEVLRPGVLGRPLLRSCSATVPSVRPLSLCSLYRGRAHRFSGLLQAQGIAPPPPPSSNHHSPTPEHVRDAGVKDEEDVNEDEEVRELQARVLIFSFDLFLRSKSYRRS